jgi:hypothetical protein
MSGRNLHVNRTVVFAGIFNYRANSETSSSLTLTVGALAFFFSSSEASGSGLEIQ